MIQIAWDGFSGVLAGGVGVGTNDPVERTALVAVHVEATHGPIAPESVSRSQIPPFQESPQPSPSIQQEP
jgi:hypothetical protein